MARTPSVTIEVIKSAAAEALLADPLFVAAWRQLCASCPWVTTFQGPDFVVTWYRAYRAKFGPVLVMARSAMGELQGLLTLAESLGDRRLAVAGAWQAEYHVWVCLPELAEEFPLAAFAAVGDQLQSSGLHFTYLPPRTPLRWLENSSSSRRFVLTPHRRPLMQLGDGSDVANSLKKPGNKSRLKRLGKSDVVAFKRIDDPIELGRLFDDLVAIYDTRRMALDGSGPFQNDPFKRRFHLEMAAIPGLLHSTVLMAGPHLVAAHLGIPTGRELQLGLIAHNPLFANHSPGKFQLLFLAQLLQKEGFQQLDLTAGGDPYKERFANTWDEVHRLTVFPSRLSAARGRTRSVVASAARRQLAQLKIAPARAEALAHRLLSLPTREGVHTVRSAARSGGAWLASSSANHVFAKSAIDLSERAKGACVGAEVLTLHGRVHHNHIGDLLAYAPASTGQTAQQFIAESLGRLEAGLHLYTLVEHRRLVCWAWLANPATPQLLAQVLPEYECPPNAAVLFDLHTSPETRDRDNILSVLGTMLCDVRQSENCEHVRLAVSATEAVSIQAAEALGLVRSATITRTTRFGRTSSLVLHT